jgi:hypothetical protein
LEAIMLRSSIVAAACLTLCGCINGVGWLPDSKAFVFTTDSRALVLFDVEKRATRILVADTKSNTFWPAVSPDGKQVAVARLEIDESRKGHLQVVVYDLAGKVAHESPRFAWGGVGRGDGEIEADHTTTQLFWEPQGQKLLVYGSVRSTHGTTGIYDPETKKMESWEQSVPTAYGTSPVRPDGKGFLLAKLTGDEEKFAGIEFMDWAGKGKRIEFDFDLGEGGNKDRTLYHFWPVLRSSEWRGNTAVLTLPAGRTHIDTETLKGTSKEPEQAEVKFQRETIWSQTKLASGVQVMVLASSEKGTAENFAIVAWDAARKQRRVILEECSDRLVVLVPSPDRKYVVVRVYEGDRRGPDADMIYVVNNHGQALHTIDVFDQFGRKE